MPRLSTVLSLALVILVASFFFFWRLGEARLIEFDEGIYALVAKNIWQKNDFLTLYLNPAVAWFDKPPLYFWFSALSIKVLGLTSLAPRLPAAVFGLGTVILTFFLGRLLFNQRVGFVSALILSSTVGFLYYSRLGMLDSAVTFFLTGALLFFLLGRKNPRYFIWMGIFLGLGFLAKNLIVLLGPLIIFIFIFGDRTNHWDKYLSPPFFYGLALAFLIPLPWYVYMLGRHGQNFFNVYFLYHSFSRINQVVEGESAPLLWYVTVVRTQFRVWFPFLLLALPWVFWQWRRKNEAVGFLFLAALTIFTTFSLAQSKLIWFVLPLYPFLAVLVASFLDRFFSFFDHRFEWLLPLLVLSLALSYNFKKMNLIIPEDFNRDFVQAVLAADEISPQKPLIVTGNFYVASYYNRFGDVHDTPKEEALQLIKFSRNKFILIANSEIPNQWDWSKYERQTHRFGPYVLFEI